MLKVANNTHPSSQYPPILIPVHPSVVSEENIKPMYPKKGTMSLNNLPHNLVHKVDGYLQTGLRDRNIAASVNP